MDANAYSWQEMEEDNPIDRLYRKKIFGEQMLMARVRLEKGCHVATHTHASEQIAVMLSGRVRWKIGEGTDNYYEREMTGGEVFHLPSNVPHGLDVLEDSIILDVLSPPGPMGVDSQGKAH